MMENKNKFISLEVAKLAKKLGFDLSVNQIIDINGFIHTPSFEDDFNFNKPFTQAYSCPTLSELQTWLREKHNIIVEITYEQANKTFWHNGYYGENKDWTDFEYYDTYEKALEMGLKYGLKILELIIDYPEEN